MSSSCSQCGNEGHSSRTCSEGTAGAGAGGGVGVGSGGIVVNKGFMLFGVRVMEEEGGCNSSFRKCASMNNLAQFDQQPQDSINVANDVVNAGYASDDVVHPSGRSRERKRGVPWTEDEHRLFLLGLQKVGKGDWRGISRNFVKTRTPTQVASHAQKYFLRRNNHSRRRRRSSLFDITTHDTILSPVVEDKPKQETLLTENHLMNNNLEKFHEGAPSASCYSIHFGPVAGASPASSDCSPIITLGVKNPSPNLIIRPIPVVPPSSKMADLNLNKATGTDPSLLPALSLQLPTPSSSPEQNSPTASGRHSSTPFQTMPSSFDSSSGDSIISVA